jgi:CTP synthase
VPHLTQAIQRAIFEAGEGSDIHIVEIGGTVGDYEGLSYIEAIREFSQKVGRANCLFVHVVYVPFIDTSKEFKTKPAQNALNDLRGFGIVPDCVVVRTEKKAPKNVASKISMFGGVPEEHILLMPNADTVYRVPLQIAKSGLADLLTDFSQVKKKPNFLRWEKMIEAATEAADSVTVGLVAKYMDNEDTYLSVLEALKAAAWDQKLKLRVKWIHAETAEAADFRDVDALLVPGGFGARGVEGKIAAARFALDHNVPYLGICLGMQVAVIAAARKAGLAEAHSNEVSDTKQNVVYIMEGQAGKESTGGTLRLGNYPAVLMANSVVAGQYGELNIAERHRHRYEVNQAFLRDIEKGGIVVSGASPDGTLVEFIEAPANDYFVATQAHPEFRSRPGKPHPLFKGLLKAAKRSQSPQTLPTLTKVS